MRLDYLRSLLVAASLTAFAETAGAEKGQIAKDQASTHTTVLKTLSSPQNPEKENHAPLKIQAKKIAAKKTPRRRAMADFFLYESMEIQPLSRKYSDGAWWSSFKIDGQTFWLCENENIKSPEKKEKPHGYKIVIEKAARTLTLLRGNGQTWEEQKKTPIGLSGFSDATARKKQEGDSGTPEGMYYVAQKNPASMFGENSRGGPLGSLYISYPNSHDAWLALQEGRIDLAAYRQISQAIERKQIPPMDTGLGNYIMIHGGGASDWTDGCIATDNAFMERLYSLITPGTPVEILP